MLVPKALHLAKLTKRQDEHKKAIFDMLLKSAITVSQDQFGAKAM